MKTLRFVRPGGERRRGSSGILRQLLVAAPMLVLVAGCGGGGADAPEGEGSTVAAAGTLPVPADPPYIRGVITAVDSASVRVEADPAAEAGSPKAIARLTPGTTLLFRSGEPLTSAELTVGHLVSVWLTGPIQESYPEQGTAEAIVVEPAEALGPPSP